MIFDCDGVIIDSEPLHFKAFRNALEHRSFSLDEETYYKKYVGFCDRETFEIFYKLNNLDLDDRTLDILIQHKNDVYKQLFTTGLQLTNGFKNSLERLVKFNFPMAISSSAQRHDIDTALKQVLSKKLINYFTAIVAAEDVSKSKPDPTCYLLAAQKLKIDPEHCVAFEDTPIGISAAKSAGMQVIAIDTNFPESQLTQADSMIHSFDELMIEL